MERIRKVLSIGLCLIMCFVLMAACNGDGNKESSEGSSSQQDAGVKYAESIDIIGDNAIIASINLYLQAAHNSPGNWVFNMIYDKLLLNRGPGNYQPMLATKWETSDWKTFTFTLREDVNFHNGDHFTAQDVIDTIEAAREAVGVNTYDKWAAVDTATAVDTYTLQLVLHEVNVDFLEDISDPASSITNKRAMTEDPENGMQIGTGAYKVVDFSIGDYVVFERNDDYWGEPPITKRITLRYVPETSARLMMLQNGQSDVCFSLDPVDREVIEADTANFVSYPFVMNNLNGLGFSYRHPVCADYNFRMAVASAIDREQITLAACGIYGIPETTGNIYGYETEFRRDDIPIIPYDLDKAREYLANSIYDGTPIEIVASLETNIMAAEVVQEQLRAIGLETDIKVVDVPSMSAYLRSDDAQMRCFLIPQNSLSASIFRNAFYPGTATNTAGYENPRATELFDRASSTTDRGEREKLYHEIQEIIAADVPYINMFWLGHTAACVKGVGGLYLSSAMFQFDFRYIYKIID